MPTEDPIMEKVEILSSLEEIKKIKENIQANIENLILKEAVAINKDYPEVVQISWTQYTPSFNDGDPCVFSIGKVGFFDQKALDAFEEEEGGEISGYHIEEYDISYDLPDGPMKDRLYNFSNLVHELDDFIGAAFGTWGAQIDIDLKSGELTVSEYDCGY